MSRYIGPNCRLCRRSGEKLMLKGDRCFTPKCAVERRPRPPGKSAGSRRRLSDRGMQLKEKQKARYTYELMERQFRRFFGIAEKQTGNTSNSLMIMLERRLDNVVFRLGLADSRSQARQLVTHGHISINDRVTNIPSALVKAGDKISWKESSKKSEYFKLLAERIESKVMPNWLTLDKQNMVGQVISLPTPADIDAKFSGKAIIEYYSR
ncbi:MAG: 30S ribosomal protein S4 [Dehalococcoidales bacterium]|nr:30S ribosomal protein S4 [Dehalococcoidales bacterium]